MAQQTPSEREAEILALWERERVFARSLERDAPHGDFVFYEGPPTANAPPGLHHVEARTFKDVLPRFKTMRGYRVRRKAGWDTHGLPVELQIEKKLGLKTKREVEQYGIAAFNAQCRDSVWEFKGAWERLTQRIGFWIDTTDPYITYESSYIESVWWFLKQVHERGLLTRSHKIVPWCPRCETPLSSHEVAQGYEDNTEDSSVIVRFPIAHHTFDIPRAAEVSMLVWTTTPWTLPGNGALAIAADGMYAVVRQGTAYVLLAAPLVTRVLGENAEVVQTLRGTELIGLRYEPLYPRIDTVAHPSAYQVLDADFVSFEEGTGIVHIAPAYGEDDFRFAERGIPVTYSVDEHGTMAAGLPGAGKFAKAADADIREELRQRGLLYRDETIWHTYPFCWRCKTPLLYFARASWFITMSKIREQVQARNAQVDWHPAHIGTGRMGEWLRELKDWAITRERYWGAPMPIWRCDTCATNEVLGSFAELLARARKRNRFIVMRHGESESNVRNIISSKVETSDQYPLTAAGEARVHDAATLLKAQGITKIVASPFFRMRQTATIVGAAVGVTPEYVDALREIDLPAFDGRPVSEHHKQFASRTEQFTKDDGVNETWDALRTRLLAYLRELDAAHAGETILVCTHGDGLLLIEHALSGLTRGGIDRVPYPEYDAPHELPFVGALINDRGEFDVHRPFIDTVTWPCAKDGCRGTMMRYPEVVDVWLESGSMPFAQHHYPFEPVPEGLADDHGAPKPAGFIAEAIDQTRGWFYTLLAVATARGEDAPPFEHCIVLGHLLDKQGKKMSKSKGNIVDPDAMLDRYGADVVRWYMLTVNQPWDAKAFDEQDLTLISRKPFGTLLNVLSFWELHGGGAGAQWLSLRGSSATEAIPANTDAGALLDSWLRARFAKLHADVTQHLDAYEITEAARAITDATDDLSTWWLRRSRERLKAGDNGAQQTFTAALQTLAVLLAPFAPFTAEHIWQILKSSPSPRARGEGELEGERWSDSVHLTMWDSNAPLVSNTDAELLQNMDAVRALVSLGLEARDQAGIPVRQPLATLFIPVVIARSESSSDAAIPAFTDLIADELNVKTVLIDPALKDGVRLDTAMTPELKREGMVRELIRKVNGLRKDMGLAPSDAITVTYHTDDIELQRAIEEHHVTIERGTVALLSTSSRGGVGGGADTAAAHHAITIASAPISLDIARKE
ncbi:MAG: class I tRNA ligase family protein [bacterium]|nr:class I tRNA ligase family protein [bacterium]